MTSLDCFDAALSKWKRALAVLTFWSTSFPPKKNYSPCYLSSRKLQSLAQVAQWGGVGVIEQITFPLFSQVRSAWVRFWAVCDADAAALVQMGFERVPKIWGVLCIFWDL